MPNPNAGKAAEPRLVLVTGASRGLGRNTAIALARKGFDVIVTYQSNQDDANATVADIEALGQNAAALQLDTGDIAAFPGFIASLRDRLEAKWARAGIYGLVNNAGIGLSASFAETTEAMFDRLLNIHFKGVFFLTQGLLPLIEDGGRIVNISSGLTRFSYPGFAAYASMKGAIEVLTHYLAKELGPRGIAVNTVAPGAIETDFGGGAVRDIPEANQRVASSTALGRVGLPDDIGPMIAALLTDDNRWINGQRIEVSGGVFL